MILTIEINMKKTIILLLFGCLSGIFAYGGVLSSGKTIPGVYLVGLYAETRVTDLHLPANSQLELLVKTPAIYLLRIPDVRAAEAWYASSSKLRGLRFCHPDEFVDFRSGQPNDPLLAKQWHLDRLRAPTLWEEGNGAVTPSGDSIVIAIIDDGFDLEHPDLQANVWKNKAEIPGNQVDDDANGLIDDVNGWNYKDTMSLQSPSWHGQSVAGIIAGVGNNGQGIAGIAWGTKIMPFTVTRFSHVVSALGYVLEQRQRYNQSLGKSGAFVVAVNTSLGVSGFCDSRPAWRDLIESLGTAGVLSVAAPPNQDIDVDVEGDVPTSCNSPFLLTVLQTDRQDTRVIGAAYGKRSIDLGTPGVDILTTNPDGEYGEFYGTSASAPVLAGSIALLYSMACDSLPAKRFTEPDQYALEVRKALLNGVDQLAQLQAVCSSGGRINLERSAALLSNTYCNQGNVFLEDVFYRVYPNPSPGKLVIEYATPDDNAVMYRWYTSQGQFWANGMLPGTRKRVLSLPLDVPGSSGGVYWLKIDEQKPLKVIFLQKK